jgi:polar amino acid transport system substrate-binding protein
MAMKYSIIAVFLLSFISTLTLGVKAESVLDTIQRTGVVKVAIREDAAPFGSVDPEGNLQGYCLEFFTLLEDKLINQLNRE